MLFHNLNFSHLLHCKQMKRLKFMQVVSLLLWIFVMSMHDKETKCCGCVTSHSQQIGQRPCFALTGFISVNSSNLKPCWELANSVHPRCQIFDNPGTPPLPPALNTHFWNPNIAKIHKKNASRLASLSRSRKKTCRGSYWSFLILNVHVSLLLRPELLLVRSGVSSMS